MSKNNYLRPEFLKASSARCRVDRRSPSPWINPIVGRPHEAAFYALTVHAGAADPCSRPRLLREPAPAVQKAHSHQPGHRHAGSGPPFQSSQQPRVRQRAAAAHGCRNHTDKLHFTLKLHHDNWLFICGSNIGQYIPSGIDFSRLSYYYHFRAGRAGMPRLNIYKKGNAVNRANLITLNKIYTVWKEGPEPLLINFVKGMAIGAAFILPGISAGTVILLLGFYKQLIEDISAVRLRPYLPHLCGGAVSVLIGVKIIGYLLENCKDLLLAFLLGLLLASLRVILFQDGKLVRLRPITVLIGIASFILVWFSFTSPAPGWTPLPSVSLYHFFAGGAAAGAAMILPGISGSSALVILSIYDDVIFAVNNGNGLSWPLQRRSSSASRAGPPLQPSPALSRRRLLALAGLVLIHPLCCPQPSASLQS